LTAQGDVAPSAASSVAPVRRTAGHVAAWIRSHPLVADAVLAAGLLGAAVLSSRTWVSLYRLGDPSFALPSRFEEVAGLAAAIGPLALRRRAPLVALVGCTAGFLGAHVLLDGLEQTISAIAVAIAIYSAAAHGPPRWRNVVCSVCLVAMMARLWYETGNQLAPDVPDRQLVLAIQMLTNIVLFGAVWALGAAIGSGRRRAAELLDRTVALERQREENARRAVFDERVRIARELHDVVAHHVSVMGVQAGAARVVMGRDPSKAVGALASIEASSRQAVAELHRLLGFLRQADDPDDLAAHPGVSQLPSLAESMTDSHLAIALEVEGEERPLPPTVDLSAYRIVQEALTNTLKHAQASRADVHLRYWPDELEIEIVDNGRANGAPATSSGGLGLVGMRERAALHGGQLTAGRTADGGFAVRVRLPTPAGAL
jgi:signal transduction histidine kinase